MISAASADLRSSASIQLFKLISVPAIYFSFSSFLSSSSVYSLNISLNVSRSPDTFSKSSFSARALPPSIIGFISDAVSLIRL